MKKISLILTNFLYNIFFNVFQILISCVYLTQEYLFKKLQHARRLHYIESNKTIINIYPVNPLESIEPRNGQIRIQNKLEIRMRKRRLKLFRICADLAIILVLLCSLRCSMEFVYLERFQSIQDMVSVLCL